MSLITKPVFGFLDSNRGVSQSIQQLVLRDFAATKGYTIEFVGAEIVGTEKEHRLFKSYIKQRRWPAYIFFSIEQFRSKSEFDFGSIETALASSITILFACEKMIIKDIQELRKVEKELAFLSK
jgi:hypothetical protein